MRAPKKTDDISREEDFRDYEERNLDEGWPYDDASAAGGRPVDNRAYGQPAANFDGDRNPGYTVDGVTRDGGEDPLIDSIRPGTKGLENDDDLEERVNDAVEGIDDIDMAAIDLHVEDGSVTIEGGVDDAAMSRRIARKVAAVAGVREVVNNLRIEGVDGMIPDDE